MLICNHKRKRRQHLKEALKDILGNINVSVQSSTETATLSRKPIFPFSVEVKIPDDKSISFHIAFSFAFYCPGLIFTLAVTRPGAKRRYKARREPGGLWLMAGGKLYANLISARFETVFVALYKRMSVG